MGWRQFKVSDPIDKIDNIDRMPRKLHIVDKVDIVHLPF